VLFDIFLGKPFIGVKWLELRRDNLKVGVGSKMEAWSVKETLIDRFYTKLGTEIQNDWVVVDIGAAIGEFTIEAALQLTDGMVHAFEPNPGSINILRQNMRANNLKHVETYNLGVWSESGEIPLHFLNNEPLQAVSGTGQADNIPTVKETSIPVITLEQVVEEKVGKKIDLMKLDCEGAEYEILLNQDPKFFKKINRIIMEYHDLDERRNFRVLTKYFEELGYHVKRYDNRVHKDLGYLYADRVTRVDSR
jgi:FkbM family methyltransferase